MAPLGIGLIGLGRHGMRYVRHLSDTPPDARLVAVCRRDVERGRAVASRQGVKFFREYEELIADPLVGAVVVVTPPSLCLPICLAAVRAGKPLLIEKPLACTGADARAMVRAADAAGIPLMTAHTLRFDRAVLALKSQLAAVGARRYLVLTNRVEPRPEVVRDPVDYGGRGVLLEIGIHQLDLIRFLTGEEVTRAEWIGADGQLHADWVHHRVRKVSAGNVAAEQAVEDVPTVEEVLRAFVGALARGGPMPVTGLDGQRAVEIADACYESARTGQMVKVVRASSFVTRHSLSERLTNDE